MVKSKTAEQSTATDDPRDSKPPRDDELQTLSIRLAVEDCRALEEMAKAERKATGGKTTASGLARNILRREIRRRTGGVGETIVIS